MMKKKAFEEIHDTIKGFIKSTTIIMWITSGITGVYILIFCCKSSIQKCIINTGTSIPLFILTSSIIFEGGAQIMEWALVKREKRLRRNRERDQKLRDEGKREMHKKWEEWYNNGRKESERPKPPPVNIDHS